MNTKSIAVVLCVLGLALDGCTLPVHIPTALPNPLVEVFIDDPASGLGVAQGAGVSFHVHVALRGSSVVYRAELLANGALFLALTQEGGYSYSALWRPARAGEYYIQARVTLRDNSRAVSQPLRICVWPFEENSQSVLPPIAGYTGTCPLPAQTNPATGGNVALRVVASPQVLQFFDDPGCDYFAPPVTFVAQVDDPQDLVVLVNAAVLRPAGGSTDLEYLNWITTRAGNQKEYRGTIPLPPDTVAGTPIYATGNLTWFVDAWGRDGQLVGSTRGHLTYAHVRCGGALLQIGPSPTPTTQVLHLAPSETATLTPEALVPPTFTFRKNAFCRKGPDTAFSDVTAILAGDTVDILNSSEDGFWYFVFWKQFSAKCWVAASTGVVNGDASGIKVLVVPELPNAGPLPGTKPSPEPAPCNPLIKTCP